MLLLRLILVTCGVLGALLDCLLHVLQLLHVPFIERLQRHTAEITLLSVALILASLIVQFNAGTLVMVLFIGSLAVFSLITHNELLHDH